MGREQEAKISLEGFSRRGFLWNRHEAGKRCHRMGMFGDVMPIVKFPQLEARCGRDQPLVRWTLGVWLT